MNLPKPPVDLDIWLDKISLLHQNLSRDPNPLDADLLKRYVRSYYEALLAWERGEARASGGPVGVREAMAELRQVPPAAPFGPSAEGRAPADAPAAAAPPSPDVIPPATPPLPPAPEPPKAAAPPPPAPEPPKAAAPPPPAPEPPKAATTPPPPPEPPKAAPTPPPAPEAAAPEPPKPAAPPSPAAAGPADAEEPSLNDRFARPDAPRPLHAAAAAPAEDLRRIIDINERALFTRELFGGNSEAYGSAVRALNEFPGLAQAEAYIERELAARFSWPGSSRVVDHFRDLVRQRYGA